MTFIDSPIINFALMNIILNRFALTLLAACFLWSSCEKKEQPYPLPPKGEAQSIQFDLGSDYATQVFFSFTNGVVSSGSYKSWDLAFGNNTDQPEFWINGPKPILVYATGETEFATVLSAADISDSAWKYDDPSGLPGTSALGNIIDNALLHRVIVVKISNQYYKLKIKDITDTYYIIETAEIAAETGRVDTVLVDTDYNFSYFSFTDGIVKPEPPKADWDLVFTRYRHIYRNFNEDGSDFLYSVSGALLNPYQTTGSVDSSFSQSFEELNREKAEAMEFVANRDVIGFDWKTVNINTGEYTVIPELLFVLKDQNGKWWKFHFTGYYNDKGEKGSPRIEFMRL